MHIKDIKIASTPLFLTESGDVDRVESQLWITFPNGYREYITKLGDGVLGGAFVRVYPPWRIVSELAGWRHRITKYWFWDDDPNLLPKDRALECVIVADSMNGDELIFHPYRPDRLFVLPRDSECVFDAGHDLLSAVEWMCTSGELVEPFKERNFEPIDSRAELADPNAPVGADDPIETVELDEIIELSKQWAERHSVMADAQRMLSQLLKRVGGKDKTTTLLCKALVLQGESPYHPGLNVTFRVSDKASDLEIGTAYWYKDEDSNGLEYEPHKKT